jgi:hypothetical protein
MEKLERVIYDLERCTCHVPDACRDCSKYASEPGKCRKNLMMDALELLKEQEPVEPDGENCGECGYTLHRINYDGPGKEIWHEWFRFCPVCGKAVKWE